MIRAIDHVQLAMPVGQEEVARGYYVGALGLVEVAKPAPLAARGGLWLESGAMRVHLGVEPDFRPARKAHPAFVVDDLTAIIATLREAGFEATDPEALEGNRRTFTHDPFGNRIELVAASSTHA